ncbi:non-ribosomal peptide synthase/polyketide synthase [Pseudomonas oryzihabitans]|uniref:Amino acid adenylation domain-containing protein/non-ribosomal peptide synthase protein (TIGR01720 family) n=1 Tax=Pseudomonas oryzihabitans TaxID=47885 RepID=A0AAJ2EY29_9PSED|nr:non-ribosomal peptide synthase/polyketide synthase [Pseudomonas psychrotolerans]MDR6232875.1 amino acid adenylation domain-containing protein/non-ribosomal peptide synthase protein (TIGR01720 family) [Pseudomonas psychrotolerans]
MLPSLEAFPTLAHALRQRAIQDAGGLALRFLDAEGERTLSYGELDARARAIALALGECLTAGERAVLVFHSGPDYVAAFFGCLYAGIIAVPAYPPTSGNAQHQRRLLSIIEDAEPGLLLTSAALLAELPSGIPGLAVDTLVVAPEEDWQARLPMVNDIAFLQYTSGSTALPKGVMVSHANLVANERLIRDGFGIGAEDVIVSWLPLYHDMGLIGGLLQPIYSGIPCVLMSPRYFLERPVRWLEAISTYGGTISGGPDFAYRLCRERISPAALAGLDLSRWRVAYSGSEPIRQDSLDGFAAHVAGTGFVPGSFFACYGLAEATLFVAGGRRGEGIGTLQVGASALSAGALAAGDDALVISCGRAQPGHGIRIVAPQTLAELPAGAVGEIWAHGPSIAAGYWRNPVASAATFVERDGLRWLRTGDLGALQGEELYVTGRLKDLLIVRGQNVYPQDLERIIEATVDGVREGRVAAFAVPDGAEEGIGIACEIGRGTRKRFPAEGLIEAIRRAVAGTCQQAPAVVALLEPGSLPKTSSGKLQRSACWPRLQSAELKAYARFPAESVAVEAAKEGEGLIAVLADIWRACLGGVEVGPQADFFLLGGNSISATQVVGEINNRLGRAVELRSLFEAPRLVDFAERVAASAVRQESDVARVNGERLPLSAAQRRLWLAWQLDPAGAAYSIPGGLSLRGEVDANAVRVALERLVARHEGLRSRFFEADGQVWQRIEMDSACDWQQLDLRSLPGAERERALRQRRDAEAREPFDLTRGPLLRASLIRQDDEVWQLWLTVHHIAADGWSLNLLLDEFARLYAEALGGQPANLAPLPCGSVQAALGQEARQAEGQVQRLAWWRAALGEDPTPLAPLGESTWDSRRVSPAERLSRRVDADLAERLRQAAQARGASSFMWLLATFGLLLQRQGGVRRGCLGVPSANRLQADTFGQMGCFINTLVFPLQLAPADSFAAHLGRLRDFTLDAQAQQALPYDDLVASYDGRELFRVLFNHQQRDLGALRRLPGLLAEPLAWHSRQAKFELQLQSEEDERGRLSLHFDFALDAWERGAVERLADAYLQLLAATVATPERAVGDLPLLSEAQGQQLSRWGEAPWASPDELVPAGLVRALHAHPERLALEWDAGQLDHRQLHAAARRLAAQLLAVGAGPDVPVAICAERSPQRVVGLLAVLLAGAAYVPLDPDYPRDRLDFMLADSAAPLLLCQGDPAALLTLPAGVRVVRLDAALEAGEDVALPLPKLHPEHLAYVLYTSGSTGRPKGVVISHGALAERLAWMQATYGLDASDVLLQKAPLGFDVSVWETFWPLLAGARLVLAAPGEQRDPAALLQRVRAYGVTTLHFVPPLLQLFLDQPGVSECTSLRRLFSGGEALPAALRDRALERLPAVALHNRYGPTETTINVSHWHCRAEDGDRVPIGKPLGNVRCRVLDSELNPLPVGVPGELCIAGAGLARGYLGRPALTAERFVPDSQGEGGRLYRTGDRVLWDAEGRLDYRGRLDDQLKVRGFRIEPGEIRQRLLAQPGIAQAAVALRDTAGGPQLLGYVTAQPGVAPVAAQLRQALAAELPDYLVPAQVLVLNRMPLTANGKLDTQALPLPERVAQMTTAPTTPLQQQIATIWCEVLGLPAVGLEDDFFALGGHSLLATQIVSRVRLACDVDLSLRTLFDQPTLADFAAAVERLRAAGALDRLGPILTVDRRRPVPLSPSQQRMWFLWQLDPSSPAYNVGGMARLVGVLDGARFEAALQALIQRHETLRMTFPSPAGTPVQQVQARLEVPLEWHDHSRLPVDEAEAALLRLADAEAHRPFDLERGPLLRALLVKQSEHEHHLVLTLHHIVTEGWAMDIFARELGELYEAFLEERESPLPPLPVQYLDYSEWQRQWLDGGERARQLAYWRAQLGDEHPLLELPSDRPRPPVQSHRGDLLRFSLPPEAAQRVRAFNARQGLTLFMTCTAAFAALLHRYSGQTELRIGMPVANRIRPESEGLIGAFLNTQVLRCRLEGQMTVGELLAQVRETVIEAQAHQDLPFDQLVEALQPPRSPAYNPLFQVMCNVQRWAFQQTRTLGGLTVEYRVNDARATKFDLNLEVTDFDERLGCCLTYSQDLFDEPRIAAMAKHWQALLEALQGDPRQRLSELPLLSDEEREAQRVQLSGAVAQAATTLDALFARQAAATPEAPALTFAGATLSYAELESRANRLARALIDRGVRPGMRVGLALPRSQDLVVGLLAILKAGAAYVPLDPEYPLERLSYLLADSGVGLVLGSAALRERLNPLPVTLTEGWLDPAAIALDDVAATPVMGLSHPTLPAYVIYTSGSTGQPKGVVVAHGEIADHCQAVIARFGLHADDCELHFYSINFDAASERLLSPLLCGARVVLRAQGQWDPESICALIEEQGVTILGFTPSYGAGLGQWLAGQGRQLPVRLCITGGEALTGEHLHRIRRGFAPQVFFNAYGPTETVVMPLAAEAPDVLPAGVASVPIGRVLGARRAALLDADLALLPAGALGELYLGGACLAQGYHQRPGLTAERFVPDPFAADGSRLYRSGDRARLLADGQLEYVGRLDHQVKVRGFRIELGEIEARLREQPGVDEAVVLALDGPAGKQLVAYLGSAAATAGAESDWLASLRRRLAAALPDYMVPARWVVLPALPLTANGKLDRQALPAPATEDQATLPASALEAALAEVWADVLQVPTVGVEDNFFERGGDSILSIQLVSRARERDLHFTPRDVFQHQTVRRLASVTRQQAPTTTAVGPAQGASLPTPIQQWFLERPLEKPDHWNQAVLLAPREVLDGERLAAALRMLAAHHDALRLNYVRQDDSWRAAYAATAPDELLWQQRLTCEEECLALFERAQRSLDLARGPLLRAVLVEGPGSTQRLLLAIHHLVVDGVSWRILLEDLQRAYRGQALPARTSPPSAWAARLHDYAHSESLREELALWRELLGTAAPILKYDRPGGRARAGDAAQVSQTLETTLTRQLLQEAPAAYRTQVNDLLLSALARVLCRWLAVPAVPVQLEGHGREALFDDLDLTRSVGWFTAAYPVRLAPAGEEFGATIQAIKAQLRAVPHKGLGYGVLRYLAEPGLRAACAALPEAAISFNYLGQFDQSFTEEALFAPLPGPLGALHDPDAPLPTPLAIDCQVQDGRLAMRWTYSREQFDEASVAVLADAYRAELERLIEHCLDERAGGCSPADFPLARLDQAQLDALVVPARRIEDIYPLTPMQEGLLLHTLLEPGEGLYFMQDRYRIDSALDHERFAQAWSAVVARHEALRASFVWNAGETMLQVIQRPEALDVEMLDWRGRPAESQERDLQALLERERRAGFALLERPPFHLRLIRVAEARYWFIMSNHHILIDAWCRGLLMSDFLDIYIALGEGRAAALAPAPRYRDYIAWLQRQDQARSRDWWRATLAGLERPTELPCDRPLLRDHAGAEGGMQVADRQLRLLPTEGAQLRERAQRHGLTVNTLAQAAWALVLHRYSGDDDLSFGVTVAGRPLDQPQMQRTVGLFINSVPLRVRLPERTTDTPVLEWLRALLEANLALREHEYLPLVAIQEASEVPKGQPLFDSLFVFENAPVDATVLDRAQGLKATSDSGRTHTNFPLTVVCYPGDDLGLHLSYDRRYFDAATIERLLADFRRLLLAVAAGIEGRFAELALEDPTERQFLLETCNASARDYPLEQSYVQLFEARVAAHPQRIAAQCGPRSLSYAELNAQANRLGHRLRAVGVGFDDPVALLAERDLPLLGMMVGSFKAGAGYLPLDPTHPEERLGHILALSRARVLVCSAGCRAQAEDLLEQLACVERPRLLVWEDVQAAAGSVADLGIHSGPQHLAYIIYTSGSTGTPKGVMVEQAGMLNNQLSKVPYLGLDEHDAIAQTASQSFDISVWQFLAAPLFGGRTVIVPTAEAHEPSALLEQVAAQGISVLESVPALIQGLLESERPLPAGLRWLLPTGEAMPPALARQWLERHPGCGLVNAYGPAECADDVAFHRVLVADTRGSYLPIGAPTDNNRLYLWGAQGLVPRGAIGELCVAGIGVGRGYLGDPQRTALAFVPHPWGVPGERLYRTGDLARRRADGLLEYVGRRDHQVKLRGLRIELGEIEARLHAQPSVREAAVTVLQGPHGPYLQGYLVAVDAELAEETWFAELRDALRRVLPDYMVPVQWLLLERLPRNANGKLDRRALPVPSAEGASTRAQVEPATELERDLARIWAEVLKLERVGVTDNFFELGGHSLLATQIASRVQQNLQRTVPLRAMFECSTVRALAEYLEREGQAVLDTAQVERLDDLMSRLELL